MGRLRAVNPDDPWVEVVNDQGDRVGFITSKDAYLAELDVYEVQNVKRYLDDPYVRYHATVADERGLLKGDLNDVQNIVALSNLIKQREIEEKLRERAFLEMMAVNNGDMYKAYMEQKEREAEEEEFEGDVEWKTPESVGDFFELLKSFNEGEEDDDNDPGQTMAGLLDEETLSELSE